MELLLPRVTGATASSKIAMAGVADLPSMEISSKILPVALKAIRRFDAYRHDLLLLAADAQSINKFWRLTRQAGHGQTHIPTGDPRKEFAYRTYRMRRKMGLKNLNGLQVCLYQENAQMSGHRIIWKI